MGRDCGFLKEKNWFRYRAGGILIHDDKMLFVKSKFGDYYYMIGGGVQVGESSIECIEREIFEEAGIHARVDYLAAVCEIFFKGVGGRIDGLDCHTIEFYYYLKATDFSSLKSINDAEEELVWIPLDEIEKIKVRPNSIKSRIYEIVNDKKTIHVIEQSEV